MAQDLLNPCSRLDWIEACDFHPLEDHDVLKLVHRRIVELGAEQRRGVVLLDLDSTLYEVAPRTLCILKEAGEALASHLPAEVSQALRRLEEHRVGYTLADTLHAAGVSREAVRAAADPLREFWRERFFSNEYLRHDRPYPGTADFVRALHDAGACIVYLTGRDEPGMKIGTERNLRRDGFVFDEPHTHLFMKDHPDTDDVTHKVGVARTIASLGTLVASLENEPRNLAGLFEAFPEALHIFVQTICSEHPAPVCRGIYRLRHFLTPPAKRDS